MAKRNLSRRSFLGAAAAGAAVSLIPGRVLGANEQVNIGIIGHGSQGGNHYRGFNNLAGVKVTAVCDADQQHMNRLPSDVAKYQDLRKMLEDSEIDAVVIAAPNHWHSLAAILAMQAGKHVYVEKPVSHFIYEGRVMVNAARRYNKVVQAGTQQRSCPAVQECAADVQSGKYGKVLWAHTYKLDARDPIGKCSGPLEIPSSVDYDLYAGPSAKEPVMRNALHYDWHWQWNCGNGEMGNWAIHYIDDLRHILGWDDVPNNVIAAGNRWWDDDGETPNMHIAYMEHRDMKLVIDIRNMQDYVRNDRTGAVYLQARQGNFIQCEDGFIRISRGGGKAYDNDGNQIKQYRGNGGSGHAQNFIDGVRANSNENLAAEVEVGHLGTVMCHQANVAWRLGKEASEAEVRSAMGDHEDVVNTIDSIVTQLGDRVDFKEQPWILGPKLAFDTKTEQFTGSDSEEANKLVKQEMREPFTLPDIS